MTVATALLVILSAGPFAYAEAAGRVALVLVAEDYQKLQKSRLSAKQASDLAEALKAKDFDVLLGANTTNSRTRAMLLDFSRRADGADVAVAFLLGHATATNGQTYFLPVDADLTAATDLFSRGISVASVARLVGKAKAGGVFVLMTTPNFEPAVPGVSPRPEYASEISKNVVVALSTSAKLPVSRIDSASGEATDAVIKLLGQATPNLKEVAKTVATDFGVIFGEAADVNLARLKPTSASATLAPPTGKSTPDPRVDPQSDVARIELQQAWAEAEKAKAEAQRAQAEAASAKAEAEKLKSQAVSERAPPTGDELGKPVSTPSIDESLIGKRQRQRIQERLREMSLYTGPIDSIMGPLTREAIMGYQRSKGAQVTGYLTPEQFQTLVTAGD